MERSDLRVIVGLDPDSGQCRACMRRGVVVYPIRRRGGGTWRRGGRWYQSSICAECVERYAADLPAHALAVVNRFSASRIKALHDGLAVS